MSNVATDVNELVERLLQGKAWNIDYKAPIREPNQGELTLQKDYTTESLKSRCQQLDKILTKKFKNRTKLTKGSDFSFTVYQSGNDYVLLHPSLVGMFAGADPSEGDLHVVKLSSKQDISVYLEHNEAFKNLKKFTHNYDEKLSHNIAKISADNHDISTIDYVKEKMLNIRNISKRIPKNADRKIFD